MIALLIILIIAFFIIKQLFPPAPKPATITNDLYSVLLRKTFYDKEKAERLVELERKLNPNASLNTLIRNAINRLEMHNK